MSESLLDEFADLRKIGSRPQNMQSTIDGKLILFLSATSAEVPQLALWRAVVPAETSSPIQSQILINEIGSKKDFSKEEEMLRERLRQTTQGVTSYFLNAEVPNLAFIPCSASLFEYNISSNGLRDVLGGVPGVKVDCKLYPGAPGLVVFAMGENIAVANTNWKAPEISFQSSLPITAPKYEDTTPTTQHWMQITTRGKGDIKCGVADYIVQEEFNRMTAFWMRSAKLPPINGHPYCVLYTVTDETKLARAAIIETSGEVEQFPFPKPGEDNATTRLEIALFGDDFSQVTYGYLPRKAFESSFKFQVEYYPRMGWTPAGRVWVMVLDRSQENMAIAYVDVEAFSLEMTNVENQSIDPRFIKVVYTESVPNAWCNITDNYQFVKNTETMLFTSQVTAKSADQHAHIIQVDNEKITQLTQGEWSVIDGSIKLFENSYYFLSTLRGGSTRTLCRLDSATLKMEPLTPENIYVHSYCVPNSTDNTFAFVASNTNGVYLKIVKNGTTSDILPGFQLPEATMKKCVTPTFHKFQNNRNKTLPYALYTPTGASNDSPKKALIVHVYGGPHAQTVSEDYALVASPRFQPWVALGHYVAVVDIQSLFNNGLKYEEICKHSMGQFEVDDVVCAVQEILKCNPNIDSTRVAVFGWSYGGYLSLLCAGQRPDVFKVCIAGAPVGKWELYDTAYTERYMGTPASNPEGYKKSGVPYYAHTFPNESNRVFILHGLSDENVHFTHTACVIDALIKQQKPYTLQVYPGERHGVRGRDASLHKDLYVLKVFKEFL